MSLQAVAEQDRLRDVSSEGELDCGRYRGEIKVLQRKEDELEKAVAAEKARLEESETGRQAAEEARASPAVFALLFTPSAGTPSFSTFRSRRLFTLSVHAVCSHIRR